MKTKISILYVCLLMIIFNSCDSLVNNKGGGVTTSHSGSSSIHSKAKPITSSAGKGEDLRATFRFHTDIQAKGTFKPGELIRLSVSVRANLPTKNAEIKLFLPEIQALENKRAGQPATIPVGKPLEPKNSWSRSFSKGQTFSRQKTITISQPGYYHVFLNAKVANGGKTNKQGGFIKNATTNSIWLWITKEGGKVTQEFDSTLISKHYRNQSGPLTKITTSQRLRFMPEVQTVHASSESITYYITYLNITDNSYDALKGAQVSYFIYDDEGYRIDAGTEYIDNYGEISFPCYGNGHTYEVEVHSSSQNPYLKVFDDPRGGPYDDPAVKYTYGDMQTDCGKTISMSASNRTFHLFEVSYQAKKNSISYFQQSPSYTFMYADSTADGSYYTSNGSGGTGFIVIMDKNSNNTNIGGRYGDFTAAHEYGHAFQDKALGGIPDYSCNPHAPGGAYSLGCAYGEGFADYHAAVTSTNTIPYLHVEDGLNYFNQPFYIGCLEVEYNGDGGVVDCNEYASSPDGPIVEGAVASFLYDLTDPTSESFDNADYPGSYVAGIVKHCQVDGDDANGIDHLIACFQHGIPDYSNHFSTRNNAPSVYSESVTEPSGWNKTDIKKLWRKNLYNENYTPPPPTPEPLYVIVTGPTQLDAGEEGTWTAHLSNTSYLDPSSEVDVEEPVTYDWYTEYPYNCTSSNATFEPYELNSSNSSITTSFTPPFGCGYQAYAAVIKVHVSTAGGREATNSNHTYIEPN